MGACLSSDKPVAALGPSSMREAALASAASAEPPKPALTQVPLEAESAVKGVEAAKAPRNPRALSPRGQQLPPVLPPSGPAQGTGAAVDAPSLPAPSNGFVGVGYVSKTVSGSYAPGETLTVAVKVLNHAGLQGHAEWLAEVNFLGALHHPKLVRLVGYCSEEKQRLLVYEFMRRGSLDNHLFRKNVPPMPWDIRLKILLDSAEGLEFLHEVCEEDDKTQVIYRDFKTSNVLLDFDFSAKLSDFGLAKHGPEGDKTHVSTRVMGTYGYAAPEYFMTGHLTAKNDVYSFGVVLLEMLTGRKSMDKSRVASEVSLVDWAQPYLLDKRRMYKLLDTRLEGNYSIRAAARAVGIATACLNQLPKERPSMNRVVKELRPLLDLKDVAVAAPLPIPPPPPLRSADRMTSWPLSQKGMENADLQAPSADEQKREEMELALPRVNSVHNAPARRLPATVTKFGSSRQ
eukprot:SM000158S02031  [mRNA]  locus=s158:229336:232188:+ [translate_table: standard]